MSAQPVIDKPFRQYTFKVSPEELITRADTYLAKKIPELTRSRIKDLILSKDVLLNNTPLKPGTRVRPGDIITVNVTEKEEPLARGEAIPLDIIYSDASLIVINKPAGLVVHPAAGRKSGTLVNALLYRFKELSEMSNGLRPGIVHRLDKDTSGVMVVARNNLSQEYLAGQFRDHSIKRVYLALVWGEIKDNEGTISMPIGRDIVMRKKISVRTARGRCAVTHFKVIRRFDGFSLLELRLATGRTHQIRVHLAYINHPVVGDQTYGRRKIPSNLPKPLLDAVKGLKRQALHASLLGFIHPVIGKYMEFSSPLPEDIQRIIDILNRYKGLR